MSAETPGFLFAYGTLKPARPDEPGWDADMVRGRLYDLGPYPALVDLGDEGAEWVEGFVRAVTLRELVEVLDPYEGVPQGLFRREQSVTREGRRVWVYVWGREALPARAVGPLRRWEGASRMPDFRGPAPEIDASSHIRGS